MMDLGRDRSEFPEIQGSVLEQEMTHRISEIPPHGLGSESTEDTDQNLDPDRLMIP